MDKKVFEEDATRFLSNSNAITENTFANANSFMDKKFFEEFYTLNDIADKQIMTLILTMNFLLVIQ